MINKKLMMLAMLLVSLLAISAISAADNAASDTIAQEQSNDDISILAHDVNESAAASENDDSTGNEVLSSPNGDTLNAEDGGTFTDLQNKINDADEGATLTLENDYFYNTGFSADGITISKSLTIDGKGKTIDANGQARIFNVQPNHNLILKNLVLANGRTDGDGGAIYAYKSDLAVINCAFNYNKAKSGGAIYTNESNLTISSSKFLKNQATSAGGSILARRTNVDISNTIFEDSYAGGGGSLQILGNGKLVTANFENNVFKNSTATYTAGFFYASIPTTVINCTFENYNGGEYGGLVAEGSLKLTNSRFKNSRAVLGGAVSLNGDENSIVSNCTFENNHAQHGGAIYSLHHLTISDSCFVDNNAEYNGGAIYAENIASSVFNGNFTANTAVYGGAIYGNIEESTFNGAFTDNTATAGGAIYGDITDSIFNGDFTGNSATAGGAICGNITDSIFNGNFINNSAITTPLTMNEVLSSTDNELLNFAPVMTGAGGGIFGNVVGATLNTNFVMNTANVGAVIAGHVDKSFFTGDILNNIADYGSAVYGDVDNSVFCGEISQNNAKDMGIIYGNAFNCVIPKAEPFDDQNDEENYEFLDNKTLFVDGKLTKNGDGSFNNPFNNLKSAIDSSTNGYTIYIAPGTYTGAKNVGLNIGVELNLFKYGEGDVIFDAENNGTILTVKWPKLHINGLTFMHASNSAIIFENGMSKCVINATFMNNSNDFDGGAIYCNGNITDTIFDGLYSFNSAGVIDTGKLYRHGGVLYAKNIYNSIFKGDYIGNSVDPNIDVHVIGFGGVIYANNIVDSVFSGNFIGNLVDYSYTGSHPFNYAYGAVLSANLLNCTFSGKFMDNCADGAGGILYSNRVVDSIFNGDFINNTADESGGVISCYSGKIEGSTFNGNFMNNRAYRGGVISGNIANSTIDGNFMNNRANGGGVIAGNIANSTFKGIFKDNIVENKDDPLYAQGGVIYGSLEGCNFYGEYINNHAYVGGVIMSDTIRYCNFKGQYSGNNAKYGNVICARHFLDYVEDDEHYEYYNSVNVPRSSIFCCDVDGDYIYIEYDIPLGSSLKNDDIVGLAYSGGEDKLTNDEILGISSNILYVDGSASSNGDGSSGNPFNNLKSAIDQAKKGDTIYIAPGTYTGVNNINLVINKKVNLIKNGNGEAIFDAKNNGSIFTVNAVSLNITGLTFKHAIDSAIIFNKGLVNSSINANFENNKNKAALYITGRVVNSTFAGNYINNIANGNGAAIYADYFIDSVLNGNFINNSANNGGAIAGTIISSSISGNFADNSANNGGAIAGNIISSSIAGNFKDNVANMNGGAIMGNVMMSVINAKFTGNAANRNGGAIFGNVSSTNFTGSFINNKATNGGVICGSVSSSNFNCEFNNNHAGDGGVIYGGVSSSKFTGMFTNNNASKGSVVYSDRDISKAVFNAEFINNTANAASGKLIYADGEIIDSKFLGDIFVSNLENISSIMDSASDISINWVFNVNEPGTEHIADNDIVIPTFSGGSGSVKLPADAKGDIVLFIAGKQYVFPVVNGVANVIIPDLGEGNYPYTITYSGDSKYSSFTTNGSLNKSSPKVDPKITAKNTAVQYSAKGKYSVTVYGTDGKVATGVEVIFKISGKQVAKVKTNDNGVASYVVTKNPGKYKIQATALGKSLTKTVTVKHIVTLKTVTLKKSAKKLTLQATLAKVKGKYLKKKTITFKINGKKVATAKTNSKGVAKITIKNPSVIKKLKVGKKVTYQATYLKDTVKKTAKVKK